MKAILEFDLTDSEERGAHVRAVKADNAYRALYEICSKLRQLRKYGESDLVDIHDLEDTLRDIIIDAGVILDQEYV